MRALTIRQPWASLIAAGRKRVENRVWSPDWMVGRTFAIHAGAARLRNEFDAAHRIHAGVYARGFEDLGELPFAAILGTAVLDRIVHDRRELDSTEWEWFFGPYGLVLRDIRPLVRPVPCPGALMFWEVPEYAIREMEFAPEVTG